MSNKIVELIADTAFYKKGTQAFLINDSHEGNNEKCEVRFVNEHYCDNDADVLPKFLFKEVKFPSDKEVLDLLYRE